MNTYNIVSNTRRKIVLCYLSKMDICHATFRLFKGPAQCFYKLISPFPNFPRTSTILLRIPSYFTGSFGTLGKTTFASYRVSPSLNHYRNTIITCVSRVLHVFTTCAALGCPRGKFLFRPTPFRFFSASCHAYKSTVARLKLDINANNIVCFTGDHFLTGFGRDLAVKRCVTDFYDNYPRQFS